MDAQDFSRHAGRRRFDAVICDIDGCLGPESAAPLDSEALVKVAEHNRRAIRDGDRPIVTVCSGRPQPFAEAMCRFMANDAVPCVAENGVWVFDPRSNRYLRDPTITAGHLRGVVIQPGKSASISLWHPETAFLTAQVPVIERTAAERGWPLRVSMTVAWINCDLAHISKASGIARLMAMTGLRKERLAGIGDTMSDKAIAENVAYFACPANADVRLKTHAAYVSPGREAAGVLDILGRLIGIA
jgi:hypothetical protein